jgi:hypothetical protein
LVSAGADCDCVALRVGGWMDAGEAVGWVRENGSRFRAKAHSCDEAA